MSDVILAVLITGVLSLVGNYLSGLQENKRTDKTHDLELLKIKREDKLNQLYGVFFPIIAIYTKSDTEQEEMDGIYSFYGEGLKEELIKDVGKIMNENKRFLTLDLIKIFNEVYARYKYSMENEYEETNKEEFEKDGKLIEYIFDTDREFINFVVKEAQKTENEFL